MEPAWNRWKSRVLLISAFLVCFIVPLSAEENPQEAAEDTVESTGPNQTWWSLQPLHDHAPPEPEDISERWRHNPIDRFVFAKLAERGLTPNPPAERRTLIRRLTYDLTGLPPTPEAVAAFVDDPDPRTYENLVERLLASPHYGERWGRHWLDVVRFGESRGFERNEIIRNAWPFRDYVIRSFNEDKPFNQFIIEHIAGDVVGKGRPDVEIGSAFLTVGPYDDVGNQDAVAAANIRAATVDDMIAATGTTFLGLSINCARCHAHKFDPIPTEDYYRLKAAFDGVSHGPRVVATSVERQRFDAALAPLKKRRAQLAETKAEIEKRIVVNASARSRDEEVLREPPSAQFTEERFDPVDARFIRLTILAHSGNPKSGTGARIDEFEVWTQGEASRNAALASNGAIAEGVDGNVAKDFDGAYSVELVNDGKSSARWFVGNPPVLTIRLPQIERVERVVFSHDRNTDSDKPIEGLGPMVVEYEIGISTDGRSWQTIADSYDRKPYNEGLARQRHLRTASASEKNELAQLDREIGSIDAELRSIPGLTTVWAGNFAEPKHPTTVFKGGDPMKPGGIVKPASLEVLGETAGKYELKKDAPESERRLALANWIASDVNPLTPRVLVNRVWQHHFGTGIVDTPSDFGFLGGRPSHPDLLDWLARRLHRHGWKLKALHRDILLSQTYRQSSAFREDGGNVDANARLLWRFPPRRLSAEEVRDTILSLAGKINLRMGGSGFQLYEYKQDNVATYVPSDRHGPETYRRAVYHHNARASVVDILSDFDLPDNAFAVPKRSVTTTPLQTLTMLNHAFVFDMANAFSELISCGTDSNPAAQVEHAYARAFQRKPDQTELAASIALIRSHGSRAFCRALLNANEIIYLE